MSLYDFTIAVAMNRQDSPFYAHIMAAMLKADDVNLMRLRACWPAIWEELDARYHAPGGMLKGEEDAQPPLRESL